MSPLLRRLHREHTRLVVREFDGPRPTLAHELARSALSVVLDVHESITAEVRRVRTARAFPRR